MPFLALQGFWCIMVVLELVGLVCIDLPDQG
jgi:hypothetical protein